MADVIQKKTKYYWNSLCISSLVIQRAYWNTICFVIANQYNIEIQQWKANVFKGLNENIKIKCLVSRISFSRGVYKNSKQYYLYRKQSFLIQEIIAAFRSGLVISGNKKNHMKGTLWCSAVSNFIFFTSYKQTQIHRDPQNSVLNNKKWVLSYHFL